MRWPKYWSFSFSIIPSKEIPGLISFRMDWLNLLAAQGLHLNAEFQRIARRDKKAFLSDQCKEIENNRMGKTRDLFKNIRDNKGASCKDGLDKGQKWYGPNRSRRY